MALKPPLPPMEARTGDDIPEGDEWQYEPKWDGFRCLIFRDKKEVYLQSKAGQPLGRYFPELIEMALRLKADQFVLDGEIAIPIDNRLSFNDLLMRIGLEPLQWLSSPTLAFIAIAIAIIWKASSFMALILLAGLQTIPRSLYEAADVDGATRWQQFWEITLPMLLPSIFVALIFRTITAIQTFDIPFAMTGGGPGDSTETLAMYIYKTTLDFLDFGYGSALAALMFVLSLVLTSGYLRYTQR